MACEIQQPDPDARGKLEAMMKRLDAELIQIQGRRIETRRSVHAPITLGVQAGGYKALYRGWATDLSPDGIGILCEHEAPVGSVMVVDLSSVMGEEMLLPIRICYVNQLLPHTYRIGATFSFVDSDPQARRLSA